DDEEEETEAAGIERADAATDLGQFLLDIALVFGRCRRRGRGFLFQFAGHKALLRCANSPNYKRYSPTASTSYTPTGRTPRACGLPFAGYAGLCGIGAQGPLSTTGDHFPTRASSWKVVIDAVSVYQNIVCAVVGGTTFQLIECPDVREIKKCCANAV